MVPLKGENLNDLFQTLSDWEDQLKWLERKTLEKLEKLEEPKP